jgi:hypothetical protein
MLFREATAVYCTYHMKHTDRHSMWQLADVALYCEVLMWIVQWHVLAVLRVVFCVTAEGMHRHAARTW